MEASNYFLGAAAVFGIGTVLGVRSLFAKPAVIPKIDLMSSDNGLEPVMNNEADDLEREKLEELSWLWADKELYLEKISFVWREPEEAPSKAPRPHFEHLEIGQFYDEYVAAKVTVKGGRRAVIVKILQILDKEGECPSVMGKGEDTCGHEPEREIGNELYQYLSLTPLWKHSLLVARKYVAKFQYDVMVPDALIISLGHDLGKIPRYYKKIYKSGDHAALSTNILNGIAEYCALPNRNELNRIIMSHHLLVPCTPLAEQLKAADGEARSIEGEGFIPWLDRKDDASSLATEIQSNAESAKGSDDAPIKSMANSPQKKPAKDLNSEKDASEKQPVRKSQAAPKDDLPNPVQASTANVYALEEGSSKKGHHVCSEIQLPEWWDAEKILAVINESINKIIKNNDGKPVWMAASDIGTGMVWVDERLVWESMKTVAANRDTKLLMADANVADRRDFLYTAISELGRQKKVETSYMGKGYYQVPVNAITGSGKSITMFLIPFIPEAFGETAFNLGVRKGELIQKMVAKILPKQFEAKQCSNV